MYQYLILRISTPILLIQLACSLTVTSTAEANLTLMSPAHDHEPCLSLIELEATCYRNLLHLLAM